jgi:hypothetical protein
VLPPADQVRGFREAVTNGDGPNGAHIIFLNFGGATLKAGNDNSATDTTQILKSGTVQYPAFDPSPYTGSMTAQQVKDTITNQMATYFAQVNAQIVQTRPPAGKRYTTCMVGGTPSLVLGSSGTGAAGVAPLDCDNQQEGNIVYAFSEVQTPQNTGSASASMKSIATTCAQEVAHAFGLGHTVTKTDVMYPYLTNGTLGFTSGSAAVQNDGSGQCGDGKTQDSLGMLQDVMGKASGTPMTGPAPTVAFVTPTDGSTVPLMFDIIVAASEMGGTITKVEITSGGQVVDTLTTAPYKTSATAQQDGQYELTATAYDDKGNYQSVGVTFTAMAGAPPQNTSCSDSNPCPSGFQCSSSGDCVMPGTGPGNCTCPTGMVCQADGSCAPGGVGGGGSGGGVGDMCKDGSQCASGICASSGNMHYCTQTCEPSNASSCPKDSTCISAGSDHICQPNNLNGGGVGCGYVGAGRNASGMLGLCFAFALLALSIARRRRSA